LKWLSEVGCFRNHPDIMKGRIILGNMMAKMAKGDAEHDLEFLRFI